MNNPKQITIYTLIHINIFHRYVTLSTAATEEKSHTKVTSFSTNVIAKLS